MPKVNKRRTVMPRTTKTAQITEARSEYSTAKRRYKKEGKAAFGKPKTSKAYKVYKEAKAEYRRTGRKLGKLTEVA
jgi:hypothetical protein